jgi:hypothetical protein
MPRRINTEEFAQCIKPERMELVSCLRKQTKSSEPGCSCAYNETQNHLNPSGMEQVTIHCLMRN